MKTLKVRIYTKHFSKLNNLTSSVNFMWNYVNDLGLSLFAKLFVYEINEYTKGSGELLGLYSQSIQSINETYVK